MKKIINAVNGRYHKRESGLCHRCEHRAAFMETGGRPRYECGQPGLAVSSCYMYLPVKPVALKAGKGDSRSLLLPPMLAGRAEGYDSRLTLQCIVDGKYLTKFWASPKRVKKLGE